LWQQSLERSEYREAGVALWHELWHPVSGLLMLIVAAGLVVARQSRMVTASALSIAAILAYQMCAFWFETLAVAGVASPAVGALITPLAFAVLGALLWRK
jgi:lipopolysaccharide export LptBFGC system permease protein LptF